jgi:Flp pilus assembly pilin Flp
MQYGLIAALVALVIIAGVSRAGHELDGTFCKISHAFQPAATCGGSVVTK